MDHSVWTRSPVSKACPNAPFRVFIGNCLTRVRNWKHMSWSAAQIAFKQMVKSGLRLKETTYPKPVPVIFLLKETYLILKMYLTWIANIQEMKVSFNKMTPKKIFKMTPKKRMTK